MRKAILLIIIAICVLWTFNQWSLGQVIYPSNEQSGRSGQLGRDDQFGNRPDYNRYGYSASQQFGIKDLIGDTVMNQQGDNLGNVADVIASQNGQISYIILSRGGILGFAGQLTPVPWQAADVRISGNQVMVNLTRDRLNNAPSWQSGSEPDFSDPRVQDQINSYFGAGQFGTGQPYYDGRQQPSYGGQGAYEGYGTQQGTFGEYRSERVGGGSDYPSTPSDQRGVYSEPSRGGGDFGLSD